MMEKYEKDADEHVDEDTPHSQHTTDSLRSEHTKDLKEHHQKEKKEHVLEKDAAGLFASWTWEDYALAAVTVFLIIFYAAYISGYTQVPSPVYGGDLYRDRGFVKNIVAGNPVWSDGFYAGELQYYPYLIFVIEAGIAMITGMNVDSVFLFFPIITLIAAAIVWYALGQRLFKTKKWGLVTALVFLALLFQTNPKGAQVALFVFIPAFLLFWLRYEQEGKRKDAVFAGVFLGLVGLTWGGIFLASVAMIGLSLLYHYLCDSIKNRRYGYNLWTYAKKYYLIFLIGILIFMLFFAPLAFKYQLHEVNEVTKWGDTKIELLGPVWVLSMLRNIFFSPEHPILFITGVIGFIGLVGMLAAKKTRETQFILLIFAANIITVQHHLITRPLFGASFLPEKMVYLHYLIPLFFVFGIITILHYLKNAATKKTVLIALCILLIIAFGVRQHQIRGDTWEIAGRGDTTYINALYGLAGYIETNIPKNETILSNDESGFMLAVLSGNKVMLTRRTHASYYVDIDQRIADAAVIMYGNDEQLSKRLLEKYHVTYFYVDQSLFQYPMRVRTDLKEYLTEQDIAFVEAYDRYDIAVPPERANMRNLLIIPPQNFSSTFTQKLEKVYTVAVGNQAVGELYKIRDTPITTIPENKNNKTTNRTTD